MRTANENPWVLLLAAGDGVRLRYFTMTDTGVSVPKQFCSLQGGASLLQESLHRANAITTRRRICASVAVEHRQWWQSQLWSLPPENVFAQPNNRGTANGILLPLLHILERDPAATVIVLPCSHYVRDKEVLTHSLREVRTFVTEHHSHPILLGMDAEVADSSRHYILPSLGGSGVANVIKLIERPPLVLAQQLIERGALWNSQIIVANAMTLFSLFQIRVPQLVTQMHKVAGRDMPDKFRLAATYRCLPTLDFFLHILPAQEHRLGVLRVPRCGYNELATPEQLLATLAGLPVTALHNGSAMSTPHLNLAAQHSKLQRGYTRAAIR